MTRNEKIRYVETMLNFHFEGGFSNVMDEGDFGEDEIDKWVSMSYLYACFVAHAFVTPDRSKDAFLLLEDLYTSVSIDLSMGIGLDDLDLDAVGSGYGIAQNSFPGMLEYALGLLKRHGPELWRLLDTQ